MSSGSGTPTGGGYMRHQYIDVYVTSSDDLEDDACSILQPQSLFFRPPEHRLRLLLHMYLGLSGVVLNVVYVLCTGVLALDVRKSSESLEMLTTYGLTFVTILGLVSFSLFCFALWPIWSFFTLPLVFTLLMASMVILSYLVIKQQPSSSGSHKRFICENDYALICIYIFLTYVVHIISIDDFYNIDGNGLLKSVKHMDPMYTYTYEVVKSDDSKLNIKKQGCDDSEEMKRRSKLEKMLDEEPKTKQSQNGGNGDPGFRYATSMADWDLENLGMKCNSNFLSGRKVPF
ncbi:hypothetical protein L1987_09217 [Smallanthus sonchifolius]|uniref:Uncharacterized protein n=1 Tax=Smallanthus sonchifolius TaxID=185202 RepID=A0ACB9JMB7_9ASTR|nr:hypothetical protein L1987_09217 [Smallanthus sonchifolius]